MRKRVGVGQDRFGRFAAKKIPVIEKRAYAAQKSAHPVKHWDTGMRTFDDPLVTARALAGSDESHGLSRTLARTRDVIEIDWVDAAFGRPIQNRGPQGSTFILHHQGQALGHLLGIVAGPAAPGIKWIHGRQFRVEDRFERGGGVLAELGQGNALLGSQINDQLAFAA